MLHMYMQIYVGFFYVFFCLFSIFVANFKLDVEHSNIDL